MTVGPSATRRGFLKGAALSGTALVVGFDRAGALAAPGAIDFNPFVRIDGDGVVTVILKHFETGQGTMTGLATLVAEELDADWDRIETEFAPADGARYANLSTGIQGTGGSTAIANAYVQYRRAGAAARAALVAAAARAWGVAPSAVRAENGTLRAGGRSAGFGEFAADAARLAPPAEPALKDRSDFRLIGRDKLPRKDSPAKTDGGARFAFDVKLPGMVHAVILRPDRPGAALASFDAAGARDVPGFIGARALPDGKGVAVFGESTWAAISAREAITAAWDRSGAESRSTRQMFDEHLALVRAPATYAVGRGDVAAAGAAIDRSARTVEAEFLFPHLAHAPMEPVNCVVEATANGIRLHDGCQSPGITQLVLAQALKMRPEQIEIDTVYAGGSFGRRANPPSDYHVEAVAAFDLIGRRRPVKLVWTREDDLRGQHYRPMAVHRVRVGLDDSGGIVGWDHRLAVQPIVKGTWGEPFTVRDGVDATSIEGIAEPYYAIANFSVGLSDWTSPLKVLWWRSVGHTHAAFALESTIDMAAEAAGRDPVAFRLGLLAGDDPNRRRLAGVLKLAAARAGWGDPPPPGRFRGVAVHKSFGSYVAQVAEVSTREDGAVRIEKVTCAVDCGVAVNPDVVRAQMEGAIGYGLGAAMRNEITFTDGVIDQSNFNDYEPLGIADIGDIEVHLVPSAAAPTGVGEPGLPPALPAVANAVYAATGKRLLEMPWTRHIAFA